jgi:hypothetical protein
MAVLQQMPVVARNNLAALSSWDDHLRGKDMNPRIHREQN